MYQQVYTHARKLGKSPKDSSSSQNLIKSHRKLHKTQECGRTSVKRFQIPQPITHQTLLSRLISDLMTSYEVWRQNFLDKHFLGSGAATWLIKGNYSNNNTGNYLGQTPDLPSQILTFKRTAGLRLLEHFSLLYFNAKSIF